jgi:hypothetical protein
VAARDEATGEDELLQALLDAGTSRCHEHTSYSRASGQATEALQDRSGDTGSDNSRDAARPQRGHWKRQLARPRGDKNWLTFRDDANDYRHRRFWTARLCSWTRSRAHSWSRHQSRFEHHREGWHRGGGASTWSLGRDSSGGGRSSDWRTRLSKDYIRRRGVLRAAGLGLEARGRDLLAVSSAQEHLSVDQWNLSGQALTRHGVLSSGTLGEWPDAEVSAKSKPGSEPRHRHVITCRGKCVRSCHQCCQRAPGITHPPSRRHPSCSHRHKLRPICP